MPSKLKKRVRERQQKTGESYTAALKHVRDNKIDPSLTEALIAPLVPRWGAAPEGAKCTACASEHIERSVVPAGGPWAGSVRCLDCGHTESVVAHVGKSAITVEPLDDGRWYTDEDKAVFRDLRKMEAAIINDLRVNGERQITHERDAHARTLGFKTTTGRFHITLTSIKETGQSLLNDPIWKHIGGQGSIDERWGRVGQALLDAAFDGGPRGLKVLSVDEFPEAEINLEALKDAGPLCTDEECAEKYGADHEDCDEVRLQRSRQRPTLQDYREGAIAAFTEALDACIAQAKRPAAPGMPANPEPYLMDMNVMFFFDGTLNAIGIRPQLGLSEGRVVNDPYRAKAALMFGCSYADVTAEQRAAAKKDVTMSLWRQAYENRDKPAV